MRTVILGEQPPEIAAFIARRHALDQDRLDEIWKGDYHMVPAPHAWHAYVHMRLAVLLDPLAKAAGLVGTTEFNLGEQDDFRVPDSGYHRGVPSAVWIPTAAIVVEIRSPDDETWEKFDFYARHDVEEIGIVDPQTRQIRWFALRGTTYEETGASSLLGVTASDLIARIDWPG